MLRVEVKSDAVTVKEGIGKASGKPYSIREQAAYLFTGDAYPVAVTIGLSDGQKPFAPGLYMTPPSCFEVKFGQVSVRLRDLKPFKAGA